MSDDPLALLDKGHEEFFTGLYFELSRAFSHPFEWMGLLRQPPWYRFRMRAAHNKVAAIFAKYGFWLDEGSIEAFERSPPQQPNEDAGGAIVRKLRQAWQRQTGLPYEYGR